MVCPEPDFRLERRPSFPEEEDEEELLVAGVSFHNVEEGLGCARRRRTRW